VTRRQRQRLDDIMVAIEAIRPTWIGGTSTTVWCSTPSESG